MKTLIEKIFSEIKRHQNEPSFEHYDDCFGAIREYSTVDKEQAYAFNAQLRNHIVAAMPHCDPYEAEDFYKLYNRTLLFCARDDFDSYLLYLEHKRKPEERFYQPRRKRMKVLVDALQDLADDKLDELFLSMPPRVGKTSLLMFFCTWILGRDSESSNLYSAFSDTITKAFYNGILEILNDTTTYAWKDIFPMSALVATNSQEETLNLDRKKRYPSLTCRSLYGTLNGACDANGFLITDDLIGGIEEALNKDRMISAWSKVDNNLLTRAKEKAKILWCGTRWSVIDPAGIRMELLQNDAKYASKRFRIINIPALNEDDESNFNYDYHVGFDTEYYHQRRASFERNNDIASWNAQFMQEPIERDGCLFNPADFRYYNGILPNTAPDRIFMAVDPAFGGGDFVAAPICFQFGEDIYIHDVVYDNGDKRITQPLLANAIKDYGITTVQIEANKSTEAYKDGVEEILKQMDISVNITTKAAPTDKSKEQRIFDKAPDIREFMIFRESGRRSKSYSTFMQNVFSFKMFAKNKNDDAPDSLSMAIAMTQTQNQRARVFQRFF